MRRLLASLLVVLSASGNFALGQDKAPTVPASAPVAAPSQPPPPNTLQDGTAIKLRLAENLTSATAKAGQQVSFEVVEEVDVEGVPVIAQGAQALATVTTAETKKSMGRGGKLDVRRNFMNLPESRRWCRSTAKPECAIFIFAM